MAKTPESKVVSQIRNWLKDNGYLTFNMIEVKPSGTPDMLVLAPGGDYTWLEIKSESGRLQPVQTYIHDKLRCFDAKIYTVSSLERVKEIFS